MLQKQFRYILVVGYFYPLLLKGGNFDFPRLYLHDYILIVLGFYDYFITFLKKEITFAFKIANEPFIGVQMKLLSNNRQDWIKWEICKKNDGHEFDWEKDPGEKATHF